ncbi:hypothetical protein AAFP30_12240 [Gordonia sp. CPCC 205515]|uniref:hypothetical protein n=1 Tax=Gordonia sp. CPCC 205515 TaxID=3140791 RepID=UPI003AF40053
MTTISRLASDLSRLGRESDMLDTIVTMMGDDLLDAPSTDGRSRREVVATLADSGFALAAAVDAAAGNTPTDTAVPDDARVRYRESNTVFAAAADRLDQLPDDAAVEHAGVALQRDDVVGQRIAEVVLANNVISRVWTLDEADPDSVLNALDAMVRRLESRDDAPSLTLATLEGDRWELHGGGQEVSGTREHLAQWLAHGEADDLPAVPAWS